MKKKPLFVAYSTQKGGVGKTTFTILTASYFQFVLGYNVGIIDCDSPQINSCNMRLRDSEKIHSDKNLQQLLVKQFENTNGKMVYPIMESCVENGIADAETMINGSDIEYDIIFFDLPGTIKTAGVMNIIPEMDYIFSPIKADRGSLETTLAFTSMLNSMFILPNIGKLKGMYLFWNEVKSSAKSILYDAYNEVLDEQRIFRLNTTIPETVKFNREISDNHKEIFRCTFFPADKGLLKSTRLDLLFEELRVIFNL